MQVNHTPSLAPVPSRFPWILSLTLLTIVVIATIGLGGYNYYLDKKIEQTQSEITTVDAQIQTASVDRKVVLTQILRSNAIRPSLDIMGLISAFRDVASSSHVRLKGFNVANDVISTTLIATEGDPQIHPDPASMIIKMMREYAQGQKYFELEPISALSGDMKERTTAIQLKVVGKKY